MNTRQRERVADLGRAFQSALEEIIDMEDNDIQEDSYMSYPREEEVCGGEPGPTPLRAASMDEKLAQYEVNIRQVHNGFIVNVGCQTFAFETFDKLTKYMKMYYEDPQGTYKKHYKGELIK